MDELIDSFSIERVGKSGSKFDPEKAKWFNHQYLQARSNNQLALEFREFLRAQGYQYDIVDLEVLVGMVKERVDFVKDIWDQTDFFFKAPINFLSKVLYFIDSKVIDKIVNLTGITAISSGEAIRKIQSGNIGLYLFIMTISVIGLILLQFLLK